MAKRNNQLQDRRKMRGRRRGDHKSTQSILYSRMMLVCLLATLTWFMLPTVIFMFFATIPTTAILVTERSRHRYTWICVGCLNVLGAIPWVLDLWFGRHSIEVAFTMLTNISAIMTIYSIAFIGWIIHKTIPPIVETYIKVSAHKRIQMFYEEQQNLIDEWGNEVVEETAKTSI
ncbi:MAG: hypothetical protein GY804_05265 [Alphaproteobacteria bacterium]|nr:hypothetical protein [Alphaproteobacteria bacterium]